MKLSIGFIANGCDKHKKAAPDPVITCYPKQLMELLTVKCLLLHL